MDKTKVEVTIANQQYNIISEEPSENVLALASDVDKRLGELLQGGSLSLTQALVLTALDFANEAKKNAEIAQKLKSQIGDYLQDAEIAMTERDKYKRELEKLKRN